MYSYLAGKESINGSGNARFWPSQPGDFKNQHLLPQQQVSKKHIIDSPPCRFYQYKLSHIYETHWILLIYKDNEKWNPHVPRNISFLFCFSKERSLITLKSKSAQSPEKTFSIHPVSSHNRAKFFPLKSKQKKITAIGTWNFRAWVAHPGQNGRLSSDFIVKTFWPMRIEYQIMRHIF